MARPARAESISPRDRLPASLGASAAFGYIPQPLLRLLSSPVDDEAAIDLAHGRHTRMPHHQRELTSEEVEHLVHTRLAEGCEPPDVWPANADGFGPEGEGLEDVGTSPNPAVDENRHLALYRVHDFRETFDRRAPALLRSPPVVRHDDPVHPVFHGERRVLASLDAFEHELHLRSVFQPAHKLPGQPGRGQ